MISWIEFALALLKLVNYIVTWAHERELITQGQREEIARQAEAIQAKVAVRDKIRDEVNGMSETEVDAELGNLVDKPVGDQPKPVHPGTNR